MASEAMCHCGDKTSLEALRIDRPNGPLHYLLGESESPPEPQAGLSTRAMAEEADEPCRTMTRHHEQRALSLCGSA